MLPRRLALLLTAALAGTGCGASPPRHPVVAVTDRLTAKIELVRLVVNDPVRAERVRDIYLQATNVVREYNAARARTVTASRGAWRERVEAAPSAPVSAVQLEGLLAPPLDGGFERFRALRRVDARGAWFAD